MHSRSVLMSSTSEATMASLIFGYIASMATIGVVLMVLLNNHLQPSSPTALQQQPPPVIGRNAASDHQSGQLAATPGSTERSASGEALRTVATDVEVSRDPESMRPLVEDSDNAQPPVTAEAAPTIPDSGEEPVAAPAEERQKLASHHRVRHERSHHGYHRSFSRYDGRLPAVVRGASRSDTNTNDDVWFSR